MQGQTGIPFDLATVIQAVIVLLVATPALIKQVFHLRSIRSGAITVATKGWA
jgi:simple sugar transport system permease protein